MPHVHLAHARAGRAPHRSQAGSTMFGTGTHSPITSLEDQFPDGTSNHPRQLYEQKREEPDGTSRLGDYVLCWISWVRAELPWYHAYPASVILGLRVDCDSAVVPLWVLNWCLQ